MPQVPYRPYPEVSPLVSGEHFDVQTTPAQFGANIGAAVEHLGTTVDKVGGEMWDRAIAMQQLQNETDARAAAATYAEQQAKMQADYDATVGQDAVSKLEPHLAASRQLRDDTRATLNNPMAQKLYDGMTFGFLERNIFSSARHSGDAQRQNTIDGYAAEADVARRSIESDPDNPKTYEESKARYVRAVVNAAKVKKGVFDEDDPIIQDARVKAEQDTLASKINGISRTDPVRAMQMLQDNKKDLGDEAYDRLYSSVVTKGHATIVANVVDDTLAAHRQPDGSYDLSLKDLAAEAKDKVSKQFPDFPALKNDVERGVNFKARSAESETRIDRLDGLSGLRDIIAKTPDIQTAQDLVNHPDAAKFLRKVSTYDASTLDHLIQNVRTKEFGEKWKYNYTALKGMSTSDVTRFLNEDLYGPRWELDPVKRVELQNKQLELAKKPAQDPRVGAAMAQLEAAFPHDLDAMNVRRADRNQPDSDYNHFRGMLQEALDEYAQKNPGKSMPFDELTGNTWKQLRAQQTTSGMLWGTNTDFSFKQWVKPDMTQVPDDFRQRAVAETVKKFGFAPTDQQIYKAYLAKQYERLTKSTTDTSGRPLLNKLFGGPGIEGE